MNRRRRSRSGPMPVLMFASFESKCLCFVTLSLVFLVAWALLSGTGSGLAAQ